jgi:NADPH-dependent curcumin reductase CurA
LTGHIAVQWAKLKGAHVIGLTSTKQKANVLKELGVDRVINYKEENIDDVLTNEYPV